MNAMTFEEQRRERVAAIRVIAERLAREVDKTALEIEVLKAMAKVVSRGVEMNPRAALSLWDTVAKAAKNSGPALEMIPLIVGQCHGDGVFAIADKLVVVVAGLIGEDHSCALYRDGFAIPHHID